MKATGDRTDTRKRILLAAEKLFGSVGFESTTVRAVALEAGVNLALINYHFGSKDGLYRELIISRVAPFRDQLKEIASDSSLAGGVKLERYIDAYWNFAQTNSMLVKINLREITKDSSRAQWFAENVIGELMKYTVSIIADAHSDGTIRGDISPVTFIPMIIGSILFRSVAFPIIAAGSGMQLVGEINSPATLKEMKDVLFNGIKAR